MKQTAQMPQPSGQPSLPAWKQKLLQAREMRDNARAIAYDRVKLLMEVYDDADFRLEYGNRSTEKLAAILDDYVDDLDYDFLDLAAVMRQFPNREDWQTTKLSRLYQQMIDAGKRQAAEDRPPQRRTAPTPTQLKQENETLQHKLAEEQAKRRQAEQRLDAIRRHAPEVTLPCPLPQPTRLHQPSSSNDNSTHHEPQPTSRTEPNKTLEGIAHIRELAEQYRPHHEVFGCILTLLESTEAELRESGPAAA